MNKEERWKEKEIEGQEGKEREGIRKRSKERKEREEGKG